MRKQGLEKYRHLREYMDASERDLRMLLGMVDALLEDAGSCGDLEPGSGHCLNVNSHALRIRSLLSSRMAALQDLIVILRGHGIEV